MTGIERLRRVARIYRNGGKTFSAKLLEQIADQIERERDAEVADSPYDAILPEDREAIAWVRERGGLESVKAQRRESMPRAAYERKKAGFLGHIAECEAALGRRRETISELNHRASDLTRENAELRKRAMPEGCEWPTCTDCSPVKLGDRVKCKSGDCTVNSVRFYKNGGVTVYGEDDCNRFVVVTEPVMRDPIERVRRPSVLAADGEPLEVGQTVYATHYGYAKCTVLAIEWVVDGYLVEVENEGGHKFRQTPDEFTHRAPVLAGDGVPLREGETVWLTDGSERHVVLSAEEDGIGNIVTEVQAPGMVKVHISPRRLTHERPDTWERLEEDATIDPRAYCSKHRLYIDPYDGDSAPATEKFARDLVRRARALAERERGE